MTLEIIHWTWRFKFIFMQKNHATRKYVSDLSNNLDCTKAENNLTYLVMASSVRASPVLCRPITTHLPSSNACWESLTTAGTLADIHMCLKKRCTEQPRKACTYTKWKVNYEGKKIKFKKVRSSKRLQYLMTCPVQSPHLTWIRLLICKKCASW